MFRQVAWGLLPVFLVSCLPERREPAREVLLVDTGYTTAPGPLSRVGSEDAMVMAELPGLTWKTPLNYADGTLHAWIDIVSWPSGEPFKFHYILEELRPNGSILPMGHHWWSAIPVSAPGVHTAVRQANQMGGSLASPLKDIPRGLNLMTILQYPGTSNKIPFSDEKYFPMKLRVIWVAVAEGATFSGWDTYVGGIEIR